MEESITFEAEAAAARWSAKSPVPQSASTMLRALRASADTRGKLSSSRAELSRSCSATRLRTS